MSHARIVSLRLAGGAERLDQFTRRIIGFGVHAGYVDGVALCRMFNKAIARTGVPK